MGLRNLNLKQEYRSDRDDIVHEFFIRCLSSSVSYDRSIEYASVRSLVTLALGSGAAERTRIRVVSGNRYRASDIATLARMFSGAPSRARRADGKLAALERMIRSSQIEIKVAMPSSEEIGGTFTERIGIFVDSEGDAVAFTGTSNQTFDAQNFAFESIDVFTSWEDASRVETKKSDFAKLWENKTMYLTVMGFAEAEAANLLKYSSSWAFSLE